MENTVTLGQSRRKGATLTKVEGGGPEHFYSAGLPVEKADEVNRAITEGMVLCGVFKGTRKSKVEESEYLVLQDEATQKLFGVWTTGQLSYRFSQIEVGKYVEITYNGRITNPNPKYDKPMHDFSVSVEQANN